MKLKDLKKNQKAKIASIEGDMIFKKKIYSITHGEPWKDLLFMIALAALLVPLHHWLEHRVLHYLTSHNRLTSAGQHIRKKLFRRTKEDFDSTSP